MLDPVQISGLQSLPTPGGTPAGGGPAAAPSKSFAEFIYDRLDEVNKLKGEADAGVQRLLTGESDNYAEVFAASNKAGIAFDLLMEVRNKLVDAYREIQQMRV